MYSRLLSMKFNKGMAPRPGSPRVRNAALLSLNFSGETILQFEVIFLMTDPIEKDKIFQFHASRYLLNIY